MVLLLLESWVEFVSPHDQGAIAQPGTVSAPSDGHLCIVAGAGGGSYEGIQGTSGCKAGYMVVPNDTIV